jgi:predicted amidohydrolase
MLDVAGNVTRQIEFIRTAAAEGSRLVVLPECSTTGWCFTSADEVRTVAEAVPDGPTCSTWLALCRELDIHLVAGIVEADGDRLFNSAVLLGPTGHLGTFRKAHLWAIEKELYSPGDLGFPVFETPLGRIAMHICYDGWFSEAYRLPALCDADLLCVPANWVPIPSQPDHLPKMANMLCCTHAHMNLVYIAAASRVGVERGQPFIGSSLIVDHSGWPLAGPASGDEEVIISAVIDPVGSRAERTGNPFNQPLLDRRTDIYSVATAY